MHTKRSNSLNINEFHYNLNEFFLKFSRKVTSANIHDHYDFKFGTYEIHQNPVQGFMKSIFTSAHKETKTIDERDTPTILKLPEQYEREFEAVLLLTYKHYLFYTGNESKTVSNPSRGMQFNQPFLVLT